MDLLRITVDFNSTIRDRVLVADMRRQRDASLAASLIAGQRVILTDEDDIEVEATLDVDETKGEWFGLADWATRRGHSRWILVHEESEPDIAAALRKTLVIISETPGVALDVTFAGDVKGLPLRGNPAFPEGSTF